MPTSVQVFEKAYKYNIHNQIPIPPFELHEMIIEGFHTQFLGAKVIFALSFSILPDYYESCLPLIVNNFQELKKLAFKLDSSLDYYAFGNILSTCETINYKNRWQKQ